MERRDFLKLCGLAGMAVAAPIGAVRAGKGIWGTNTPGLAAYEGKLYLTVHANGGWDPTLLCDPKGGGPDNPEAINRTFDVGDIEEVGPFKVAPIEGHRAFFEKYQQDLLVINGIDMQTNGHDSGRRHFWSGSLTEGTPAFAALAAAAMAPEAPMAYLSNGGYAETAGLVARTRSGNTNALARLAYPERQDPEEENSTFHSERARELILDARMEREDELRGEAMLYRRENSMDLLFSARSGAGELQKLQQFLPEELSQNSLERQAQVAIAAYRAGITVAANLSVGGFDTHGDHDDRHIPRMQEIVSGLDFIMEEAARQNVADKVVVLAGSDFGRTPRYNDGNGKDHWSVSSAVVMGAGVSGNRVVGATDDGQTPRSVNPNSLDVDDGGIRIEPKHIHHALRKLADIEESEGSSLYPVVSNELKGLFG